MFVKVVISMLIRYNFFLMSIFSISVDPEFTYRLFVSSKIFFLLRICSFSRLDFNSSFSRLTNKYLLWSSFTSCYLLDSF